MKASSPPPSEEAQLLALLAAMEAAALGDFSHRLPVHGSHPLVERLAEAFNTSAARNAAFTQELLRVLLAITAGDLRQKVALEIDGRLVQGELLRIGTTVNAMVDQLSSLTAEVARVANEVGVEGRLGARVQVRVGAGVWRELTDSVNVLADNFTAQMRDLARVAVAVARGELGHKITVDARGELLELKNTVNTMVDQLSAFAAEVNRVAKEVGPEGKSGGPTELSLSTSGVWRELTDNVTVTEQLALASRYKSEFLANMSHELRTPLNSLLILARVLSENKESRLSSKEVEYAKTIHASGTDLLSLINEILDLSKVEAGKMQVHPSDVPLTDVKEFVERSFRHVAEQRGLGFAVSFEAGLPSSLSTDPQRLYQVLKNLLSNALKFTDRGRVELRITLADRQRMRFDSEVLQRAEQVLAFSVVDTGIGIPQDKQERIFEAFEQVDGTTSRKYGGTGLGLSISRAMAHLLGGELRLESQPGQGSTFTLYLPEKHTGLEDGSSSGQGEAPERGGSAPESDHRPQQPPAAAEPDASLAGCKVLIVDDDIRNVFALTSVLEGHGLEVLHAENGKAGIEALRARPEVDAVLMDMMMPELDGYQTLRAIRQDPRFADLPLIAVTAQVLAGDREKCLAAGASDYLPKPVDTHLLLELLRHWCR